MLSTPRWRVGSLAGSAVARDSYFRGVARPMPTWTKEYLWIVALSDLGCALLGVFMAVQLSFGEKVTGTYTALSLALSVLWPTALGTAGGYDARFIGIGSDEFRKVLNAGVSLTAAVAIFSYAVNVKLSRGFLLVALPGTTILDLVARYVIRKSLHRLRRYGRCMLSVVAVGHEPTVAELVRELKRDWYHGLTVVGVCLAQATELSEVAAVPVYGGLNEVPAAVRASGADTVAVLACPEMDSTKLRSLACELEKTGADLCVSPALLDVAGPRTTIRATAGLTLLHVDHPQLSNLRLAVKDLFDRCFAAVVLILLLPLLSLLSVLIWLHDGDPALFTQVRVGKSGRVFRIYKFRTMVVDAEQRTAELLAGSGFTFCDASVAVGIRPACRTGNVERLVSAAWRSYAGEIGAAVPCCLMCDHRQRLARQPSRAPGLPGARGGRWRGPRQISSPRRESPGSGDLSLLTATKKEDDRNDHDQDSKDSSRPDADRAAGRLQLVAPSRVERCCGAGHGSRSVGCSELGRRKHRQGAQEGRHRRPDYLQRQPQSFRRTTPEDVIHCFPGRHQP